MKATYNASYRSFTRTLARPTSSAPRGSMRLVHTNGSEPTPPASSFPSLLLGRRTHGSPLSTPTALNLHQPLLSRRHYSTSKAIQDPTHPKGLYFHPFSPTQYVISLLPTAPPSETHPSAVGSITLPSSSQDPTVYARENPDEFVENKAFWNLLHETLKEDVVRGQRDENLIQEADLREAGWAHLADERQLLMPGRIPTPDAIIASVSFTDCQIAPDSYEINDTYRPVTREEGFIVLRDVWLEALKARLSKLT